MPEPTNPPTPDLTPQKEPATPDETPSKPPKRPQKPTRTESEVSTTSDMADSDDPGYQSRSRSQSRRRRRQNQRQRQAGSKAEGGNAESMTAVQEEEEEPQQQQQQLQNPATSDTTEMQPFERIGPASQSMDGPVTYARAMRGEIPMRGAPPSQPLDSTQGVNAGGNGKSSDMMDQDGLKLRLELNLDIEIELKASIHGDLTLAIMS